MKAMHPGRPALTRLNDLTAKMVGTRAEPKCKTKGAETYAMVLFLVSACRAHASLVGAAGHRLERAGSALLRLVDIWDNCGRIIPAAARQECFVVYQTHMALMEPEGVFIPKHHIILHLLLRSDFFGNPKCYSAWLSEAKNRLLKQACRDTSQATFDASVLLRMQKLLLLKKRPAP